MMDDGGISSGPQRPADWIAAGWSYRPWNALLRKARCMSKILSRPLPVTYYVGNRSPGSGLIYLWRLGLPYCKLGG